MCFDALRKPRLSRPAEGCREVSGIPYIDGVDHVERSASLLFMMIPNSQHEPCSVLLTGACSTGSPVVERNGVPNAPADAGSASEARKGIGEQ